MGTVSGNLLEDTAHMLWETTAGNLPEDVPETPLEPDTEPEGALEDTQRNTHDIIQEDASEGILEAGTGEVPDNIIDYTQPVNDMLSFMVLTIFFIGVISGIILGNTMWRRIRE